MPEKKEYYDILGVAKNASQDEIKKAFRRLAHEHHPDKGGDAEKFKDINEAYQILGDPKKRAQYDQFGSAAFEGGMPGGNGAGFGGFGFDPSGFSFNMDEMGDLGDILGGMFGFGGKTRKPKGEDLQFDLTLEFLESVSGVTKRISITKRDLCSGCQGNGAAFGSKLTTCTTCQGRGSVQHVQRTILGPIQTTATCSECQGRGQIPEKACPTCKGSGLERRNKELEVRIPPGMADGEALKIVGEGGYFLSSGPAGDLYIRLHVKAHPIFSRDGNDIHSTVEVPYSMLMLGGTIEVETVHGPGSLKIPEGTKAGTVFRLRGKGISGARHFSTGDHFITVQPRILTKLSRSQRDKLEELRNEGL